jgi:hypothetical protein
MVTIKVVTLTRRILGQVPVEFELSKTAAAMTQWIGWIARSATERSSPEMMLGKIGEKYFLFPTDGKDTAMIRMLKSTYPQIYIT